MKRVFRVERFVGWVLAVLTWRADMRSAERSEAVWQWSVPLAEGRAFLWIPEDCARVRGVVVAQHSTTWAFGGCGFPGNSRPAVR